MRKNDGKGNVFLCIIGQLTFVFPVLSLFSLYLSICVFGILENSGFLFRKPNISLFSYPPFLTTKRIRENNLLRFSNMIWALPTNLLRGFLFVRYLFFGNDLLFLIKF